MSECAIFSIDSELLFLKFVIIVIFNCNVVTASGDTVRALRMAQELKGDFRKWREKAF